MSKTPDSSSDTTTDQQRSVELESGAAVTTEVIAAEPGVEHELQDIRALIFELRQEHRDLDQAIRALEIDTGSDQLRISRMKKRKLRLKDQIAYWESRQIPDLNA